jgi:hypothetical protein
VTYSGTEVVISGGAAAVQAAAELLRQQIETFLASGAQLTHCQALWARADMFLPSIPAVCWRRVVTRISKSLPATGQDCSSMYQQERMCYILPAASTALGTSLVASSHAPARHLQALPPGTYMVCSEGCAAEQLDGTKVWKRCTRVVCTTAYSAQACPSALLPSCLCCVSGGYPHPLQVHYLLSSRYGSDANGSIRFITRQGEPQQAQHSCAPCTLLCYFLCICSLQHAMLATRTV